MGKKMPRLTISVIIIISMLLIYWKPSELQQRSANTQNDFYWLEPKGQNERDNLLGWVATSEKTALIFATDYKEKWLDPRRLYSFKLTVPSTTASSSAMAPTMSRSTDGWMPSGGKGRSVLQVGGQKLGLIEYLGAVAAPDVAQSHHPAVVQLRR